jgi:prolyl 4-hydroxylase
MKTFLGIKIIDNAINNCKSIIDEIESSDNWSKSTVVGNNKENYRTSSTLFIPFLSFNNSENINNMNKKVWESIDIYAKEWDFSFSNVQDVSIQKYEIGQKYGLHSDAGSIHSNRIVSALLYLNTVKEGGETYFPHTENKIKPIEGRLVIFPSNYIYSHEALPPISGIKYAAAYWATI